MVVGAGGAVEAAGVVVALPGAAVVAGAGGVVAAPGEQAPWHKPSTLQGHQAWPPAQGAQAASVADCGLPGTATHPAAGCVVLGATVVAGAAVVVTTGVVLAVVAAVDDVVALCEVVAEVAAVVVALAVVGAAVDVVADAIDVVAGGAVVAGGPDLVHIGEGQEAAFCGHQVSYTVFVHQALAAQSMLRTHAPEAGADVVAGVVVAVGATVVAGAAVVAGVVVAVGATVVAGRVVVAAAVVVTAVVVAVLAGGAELVHIGEGQAAAF